MTNGFQFRPKQPRFYFAADQKVYTFDSFISESIS